MEKPKPQNRQLENFFDERLNPSLKEKGFTAEQITTINSTILAENRRLAEDSKVEKSVDSTPDGDFENSVLIAVRKLAEDPIPAIRAFRERSTLQPWLDFAISAGVIVALVVLALCKHLDNSQTATLMGGIVGYLLGHTRRD